MDNNSKITAGQEIFLVSTGRIHRISGEIQKRKVEKVGKKYFYVGRYKFDLKTLSQVSKYSPDVIVYLSEKEIYDKREKKSILDFLRTYFNSWGNDFCNIPLEKLRQIKAIVEGEK